MKTVYHVETHANGYRAYKKLDFDTEAEAVAKLNVEAAAGRFGGVWRDRDNGTRLLHHTDPTIQTQW
jgi:hypothetical protein